VTLDTPATFREREYDVEIVGTQDDELGFDELRELFAMAETGVAVQEVPGRRPIGWDHTEDERNTQYVQFTHGDKPRTGWYLLMNHQEFLDETPLGFAQNFRVQLFFLGTSAYYQPGYRMKDLERSTNDWSI